MNSRRRRALVAAAVVAVLGVGGAAIALATGGDDDATEKPIRGSALERASDAALEHTGGGRVTGTEVGDEESKYEVEVTREDGGQVDVQLDEDFEVVGDEADDDSREDER